MSMDSNPITCISCITFDNNPDPWHATLLNLTHRYPTLQGKIQQCRRYGVKMIFLKEVIIKICECESDLEDNNPIALHASD